MERKKTLSVSIASHLTVGGESDIVIQSMTNTYNKDIEATVQQIIAIYESGAPLVRLTLPTIADLKYIKQVKTQLEHAGYHIPLVADIHFSPKTALKAAEYFDKIRINPGNFAEKSGIADMQEYIRQQLQPLVDYLKKSGKALRVGVNHGSLSERMLERYGDTEEGMVWSAIEYLEILDDLGFENVVVSLKATKPSVVVYANRLIVKEFEKRGKLYPLHLGVTEAGYGMDGRIKSAIGIGILLAEGIGDTIRVSLTEPPENEIRPARIIKDYALDLLRKTHSSVPYYAPVKFISLKTKKVAETGGEEKPKVFGLLTGVEKADFEEDVVPDFMISATDERLVARSTLSGNVYHVVTKKEYEPGGEEKFLLIASKDLDFNTLAKLKADGKTALILLLNAYNPLEEQQKFYKLADKFQLDVPVIFAREYDESDYEEFYIKAAVDLGYSFVNGRANGIMPVNKNFKSSEATKVAFKILQATGARINFTEYIACPSCGRTLFDIESTTREIEEATRQFKGIKIAVMGCIVNGLGEMADADYGYVGTKPGMVSLYRNRTLVKKDIPQKKAVEELVRLIQMDREGGDD